MRTHSRNAAGVKSGGPLKAQQCLVALRCAALCAVILVAAGTHTTIPVSPSCSQDGSCTAALNAAFAQCASAPACTIALSAGTYLLTGPLYGTWLQVNGANNFALVGAGSNFTTLLLANMAGTFSVHGGANLSFSGFAIDSVRLPYTLATVVTTAGQVSQCAFDQSTYPINETAYPWLNRAQSIIGYDVAAAHYARGGADDYFLTNPANITYTGQGEFTVTLPLHFPPLLVGAAVVLRHQVC